jgi:hypothetical protein
LGKDEDSAQARIDAVGESDVDDPVVPTKGHGRLGAITGKREEPFASTTRKEYTQSVLHVRMSLPCRAVFPESFARIQVPLSGTAFLPVTVFKSRH